MANQAAFIMLLVPVLDLSEFDHEHLPSDQRKQKAEVLVKMIPVVDGGRKKGVTLLSEHLVESVMNIGMRPLAMEGILLPPVST